MSRVCQVKTAAVLEQTTPYSTYTHHSISGDDDDDDLLDQLFTCHSGPVSAAWWGGAFRRCRTVRSGAGRWWYFGAV